MKFLLFLIACLLVPAVLTIAHQAWLLRQELRAPVQAAGTTVECRASPLYGFLGGAWTMFFGGILWSLHRSSPTGLGEGEALFGALAALAVLLIWLYLIIKVTANELGVRQRGILGWWRSAAWTQIVKVDHTSQPRGWFRLHTASGRVIRVDPGLTNMPQLSTMILSHTLVHIIEPDTLELLRRSALGEKIGNEQLNQRLYVRSAPMLRLAGGLAFVGLVCGVAGWYGFAHEDQALRWASLSVIQGVRQAAMSLGLTFILWSLCFAAGAAVMAINRARQRRRDAAASPGGTAQIQ
jgi:hypothetical protein